MRLKLIQIASVESILVPGMHGHSQMRFFSLPAHTSYLLVHPSVFFFYFCHKTINGGHTFVMVVIVI